MKRHSLFLTASVLIAILTFVLAAKGQAKEADLIENKEEFSKFVIVLDPRQKASNFSLKDLNGDHVELKKMRGKVVLINFRATW